MNEPLQQLEALSRHPSLKVSPDQRPAIVGNILHHLMHPYFLTRTLEMQEKFGERQYQAFMQALADYCLRGYVENPEPRLTIEFIQGLHRQFYGNAPSVPVKTVEGAMLTTVPGEFKTTPVFIRRHSAPGEYFDTTAPEDVVREMALLLEVLHDERISLFLRYIRLIVDLNHIHPFPDSNGKVAMLLGDLFLLVQGVHPPYYAKYKRENEPLVYGLYDDYFLDARRDISILYSVVAGAYAGSGLVHQTILLSGTSNQPDQVLDRLLEETQSTAEACPYWNLRYVLFLRYWNLRYAAFPRWDDGIQTDWQGLHSVKPEMLALQLAASLPGKVVLDGFCGIGGCAIAFARSGKKVLAIEIDERRLEMARNNARVYGVEDRITFIHGDVTELIGSLHYDAAFFDPPWGELENRQNATFCWDDFPVNPIPLIHAALARCNIVGLAVPANFNVAELHMDEYELAVQKAEMAQQLWWLNAFYRKPGWAPRAQQNDSAGR